MIVLEIWGFPDGRCGTPRKTPRSLIRQLLLALRYREGNDLGSAAGLSFLDILGGLSRLSCLGRLLRRFRDLALFLDGLLHFRVDFVDDGHEDVIVGVRFLAVLEDAPALDESRIVAERREQGRSEHIHELVDDHNEEVPRVVELDVMDVGVVVEDDPLVAEDRFVGQDGDLDDVVTVEVDFELYPANLLTEVFEVKVEQMEGELNLLLSAFQDALPERHLKLFFR